MAETQPPYEPEPPMRPHRGPMVLTFGLLGIGLVPFGICCACVGVLPLGFAIAAWVMGALDLRAMKEGRMDPIGRPATQAGMILGIVTVALTVLALLALVVLLLTNGINLDELAQPGWQ